MRSASCSLDVVVVGDRIGPTALEIRHLSGREDGVDDRAARRVVRDLRAPGFDQRVDAVESGIRYAEADRAIIEVKRRAHRFE